VRGADACGASEQSLPVPDVSDAQAAVTRALTNRIVGAHRLNRSSNRSHCMLTFHLESTPSTVRLGVEHGCKQLRIVTLGWHGATENGP
jgi:hypothetical protein